MSVKHRRATPYPRQELLPEIWDPADQRADSWKFKLNWFLVAGQTSLPVESAKTLFTAVHYMMEENNLIQALARKAEINVLQAEGN